MTRIGGQLAQLIICAPEQIRVDLHGLSELKKARKAAAYRPGDDLTQVTAATKMALRTLARQWLAMRDDRAELRAQIQQLATHANPALLQLPGIGPDTAAALLITAGDNPERLRSSAAFAALCGVSPIQASSGKQHRHRLNRGGQRQANAALHRIVLVRTSHHDPRTMDYIARRTAEGKKQTRHHPLPETLRRPRGLPRPPAPRQRHRPLNPANPTQLLEHPDENRRRTLPTSH